MLDFAFLCLKVLKNTVFVFPVLHAFLIRFFFAGELVSSSNSESRKYVDNHDHNDCLLARKLRTLNDVAGLFW